MYFRNNKSGNWGQCIERYCSPDINIIFRMSRKFFEHKNCPTFNNFVEIQKGVICLFRLFIGHI